MNIPEDYLNSHYEDLLGIALSLLRQTPVRQICRRYSVVCRLPGKPSRFSKDLRARQPGLMCIRWSFRMGSRWQLE
jgi:hypothetical protein